MPVAFWLLRIPFGWTMPLNGSSLHMCRIAHSQTLPLTHAPGHPLPALAGTALSILHGSHPNNRMGLIQIKENNPPPHPCPSPVACVRGPCRPALITRRATCHMAKNAVFLAKIHIFLCFPLFSGVFWCFLVFFGVFWCVLAHVTTFHGTPIPHLLIFAFA